MYIDTTFPPPDDRLAGLMRELNALASTDIGAAIDAMIARLDQAAGDPDLEECGLEDSFVAHSSNGPGCPIADCPELTALNGIQYWSHGTICPDDAEDEPDRCEAGEDMIEAGPVLHRGDWLDRDRRWFVRELHAGSEDDEEPSRAPSYRMDQSADLTASV